MKPEILSALVDHIYRLIFIYEGGRREREELINSYEKFAFVFCNNENFDLYND
jgi:hypothetical protein